MGEGIHEVEVSTGRQFHNQTKSRPDSPGCDATMGERLLAGVIDDYPGPIFESDDLYEGAGDEHASAVAQAHVYRLLTDRSHHALQLHLERCDVIRETLVVRAVVARPVLASNQGLS